MPNRDGTGPMGQGPMTGRGSGNCGKGNGQRRGMGFGQGKGFQSRLASSTKEDLDALEKSFEEKLVQVREAKKRLEEQK